MTIALLEPKPRGFIKLPHAAIKALPNIGTTGLALYAVLLRHRDANHTAKPSQERLSALTHLSRPTILDRTEKLVNAGLITFSKGKARHGNISNRYTFPETLGRWAKIHMDILDLLPCTITLSGSGEDGQGSERKVVFGEAAFALYALLVKYAGYQDLLAWPSHQRLWTGAGISERTFYRHFPVLFETGLIEGNKQEWQGTNRWVYKVVGLEQPPGKSLHTPRHILTEPPGIF